MLSREQLKSDEELAKRLQAELYAEASDMEEQQKKEEENKEPGLWDRLFGGQLTLRVPALCCCLCFVCVWCVCVYVCVCVCLGCVL